MGQAPRDDAKHFDLLKALDGWVFGIVRAEHPPTILLPVQPLNDRLIVDVRDDDIADLWCACTVDDEPCAIQDSSGRHAVTLSFSEPNMRSP